jgi:parallel beta-helix repeat protein
MYNETSSPVLTNVTFSGNTANFKGGAMINYNSSSPTLTNVTFSGNTANHGGGMYNWENSSPTLTNVTFSGNTVTGDGGGMYNWTSSNPVLTNVTFSGNTANAGGGGMYNNNSSPTLTNVIMWGDNASTDQEVYNGSSIPTISYSDIQGCGGSGSWVSACGADSDGNIESDPLFVDQSGGNLRLQLTSPAIDAGNNSAVPAGVTTDLDGKPRFVDISTVLDTGLGTAPIVDMGAYEAITSLYLPLILR